MFYRHNLLCVSFKSDSKFISEFSFLKFLFLSSVDVKVKKVNLVKQYSLIFFLLANLIFQMQGFPLSMNIDKPKVI